MRWGEFRDYRPAGNVLFFSSDNSLLPIVIDFIMATANHLRAKKKQKKKRITMIVIIIPLFILIADKRGKNTDMEIVCKLLNFFNKIPDTDIRSLTSGFPVISKRFQ